MENATRVLHQLTSYSADQKWTDSPDDPRVLRNLKVNALTMMPWFTKRYAAGLPAVALPREFPRMTAPLIETLAGTQPVMGPNIGLAELSRLLFLSAGVVRTAEVVYGTHPFRAAGSAGGRFPLELYVVVPDHSPGVSAGSSLPVGTHWYDPVEHALLRVGEAPRQGPPTLIVTGIPWRTGWRYRERGYRHVYWDAGTMLSQFIALADSAGLQSRLYTRFPDGKVAHMVGADRVHEWPVAVVALGEGTPAFDVGGTAEAGRTTARPVEFPLITQAQRAGESEELGEAWDRGPAVSVPLRVTATVEEVIAVRGSQRRMNPREGLPFDVLRTCMTVALRGLRIPHWVAAHDVKGLAPGIYQWPDLNAALRPGEFRAEVRRVCLDQPQSGEAAFVAIAVTKVEGLSDPQYREALLAAGLAEGRMHLAAYALGASATGMTFRDSEIPGLLGERLDALLCTCVGVPDYMTKAAGTPGIPTKVSMVMPRSGD